MIIGLFVSRTFDHGRESEHSVVYTNVVLWKGQELWSWVTLDSNPSSVLMGMGSQLQQVSVLPITVHILACSKVDSSETFDCSLQPLPFDRSIGPRAFVL